MESQAADSFSTDWSRLPLGLTLGVLIFVSFFGNVLVCVAVYTNSKLHKRENFYFVSLAGADLLLSFLVMPFGASNVLSRRWLFGAYCKYWMCIDILCCTASILHLAAISFDRYTHIKDPMRYQERMSVRKILTVIGAVWLVSIVVAFLPLAFDTNFHRALVARYDIDIEIATSKNVEINLNVSLSKTDNRSGLIYQCHFNLDPLYAVLSSLASFYIPGALMIAAYSNLYRYARHHSLAIRRQRQEVCIPLLIRPLAPMASASPQRASSSTSLLPARGDRQSRSLSRTKSIRRRIEEGDYKARVTVGVIVGALVTSWLPFFIANVVQAYCPGEDEKSDRGGFYCPPEWLFVTLTWMGYANSAQNPIIYSIFNRDFQLAFRQILLCRRRQRASSTAPSAGEDGFGKRRMTVVDM